MTQIYLRVLASPNADVSNFRIEWDLYAANIILSRLAGVQVFTVAPTQILPPNVDISITDFLNDQQARRSLQLLDYNPDGFARDGRVISIYYLSGANSQTATTIDELSCENNRLTFPILGYTVMPSDVNSSASRFLLAHEIVHSLFARVVESQVDGRVQRNVDDSNPDPNSNGSHSNDPQNLMFPTVPSSQDFTQTDQLPANLLTNAQIQKIIASPYVFQ
ncbi:hypothetical protein F7731_21960 [Cytobacillus depressus]|uniref:Uncharacterized protein n=1 Tax=Cytobacillus depressus TaxID=1602942 RepID=A0A6L3UYY8_9BACI|nr:hypothetical protein [Cytobacillus depressus]KAB2329514.1 hypothetical protein F7731_21960 [Cytobacillus depressus]